MRLGKSLSPEKRKMTTLSKETNSPKQISLLTYGSRGDVEPFIALGVGLQRSGHTVKLAAPAKFASLAAQHNIGFAPIEGDPDELAHAFASHAGMSWLRMITGMMKHVLPIAKKAYAVLEETTRDADLIVHSFLMTDAGHTLAKIRKVPDFSAQFFPMFLKTSAFPAVALPDLPFGNVYRRMTHNLNNFVFRRGARFLYQCLRSTDRTLPVLAPWLFSGPVANRTPVFFAYSPHILPMPVDWPSNAHITGYWALPLPSGWVPKPELEAFLRSGPPPVYFSTGSMRSDRTGEMVDMVIKSTRKLGQRLLLCLPPGTDNPDPNGTDVLIIEEVPHSWLFPQMRFILHHGGAGTTGAAAASGIPSTAIPHSADQSFWARRIVQLGLGPGSPPAHKLTQEKMFSMIRDATSNPGYRHQASMIAAKLQSEDGVAAAVDLINWRLL